MTESSAWNPDLYLRYKNERTQPVYDLAARIKLDHPRLIADIGCGPGNSTQVLREFWPEARVVGLDNSAEMIEKARRDDPAGEWLLLDAREWAPEQPFDLVFSNAALQWMPDHEYLIPALFAHVAGQGALAVQVPANYESPLYQAIVEVSRQPMWRDRMAGCEERIVYRDSIFYYDILSTLADETSLWHTIYYHVMDSHQGLVDWYASTAMRPYLERLPAEEEKHSFQSQVLEASRRHYPARRDGRILFPFKRLFFVAYKKGTS